MSKKNSRRLLSGMYEDSEELIYSTEESIKTKHVESKTNSKIAYTATKTVDEALELKHKIFGGAISERIVSCNCNKCGEHVNGILVNCIYSPGADIMTPFVSYECSKCKHSGFRSVLSKALPAKEFDLLYF